MKAFKNFVLAMAIMVCATLLVKFDSHADELADELSYTIQNDYYSYSVSAVVSGAQFYGIPGQTNASSDETIRIYYRTNSDQYLPMTGSQHPTFLVYSIERTDKTNGNVNTYGDAYLGDWYTMFAAKSSWSGYIFASDAAARAYFQNGDESGLVQAPPRQFDYNTDHDFREDVYNADIPVPELSNLSYNGFTVNNADEDLFLDLYVTSTFYGVLHNTTSLDDIENNVYFKIDSNHIVNSHRYNMTNYDLAYNNQEVIISELYPGVDIVGDLCSDFSEWSSTYPSHKTLSDYSFFKHSGSLWESVYQGAHNYSLSVKDSDLEKLVFSSQASVTYFVRFYTMQNNEIVNGKWISYTYSPSGAGYRTNLSIGDVASTSTGEPLPVNEVTGYQDSSGNFTYNRVPSSSYNYYSVDDLNTTEFWNSINNLAQSMGQIPSLVTVVFSFMPSWVISMIAVGIAAVVLLRFLGR